jgi:hypothetical protein
VNHLHLRLDDERISHVEPIEHFGEFHKLFPTPIVFFLAKPMQRVAVLGLFGILVDDGDGELREMAPTCETDGRRQYAMIITRNHDDACDGVAFDENTRAYTYQGVTCRNRRRTKTTTSDCSRRTLGDTPIYTYASGRSAKKTYASVRRHSTHNQTTTTTTTTTICSAILSRNTRDTRHDTNGRDTDGRTTCTLRLQTHSTEARAWQSSKSFQSST